MLALVPDVGFVVGTVQNTTMVGMPSEPRRRCARTSPRSFYGVAGRVFVHIIGLLKRRSALRVNILHAAPNGRACHCLLVSQLPSQQLSEGPTLPVAGRGFDRVLAAGSAQEGHTWYSE